MKIQLLAGVGGFPTGSIHRVIQVIPHGGHTDDAHQYLIQGQVYVPASKAVEVYDSNPGPDLHAEAKLERLQVDDLKSINADLKAKIRELSLQQIVEFGEYQTWLEERETLMKHIDKIERENVDLKNQLADIRHEVEMNGWLR